VSPKIEFGIDDERAGLKPGTYNCDSEQEHRHDGLGHKQKEPAGSRRYRAVLQKRKASLLARRNAVQRNYTGVVIGSSNRERGTAYPPKR
jgi:hypothetical protein